MTMLFSFRFLCLTIITFPVPGLGALVFQDRSWEAAYNAAWVRVKASGMFPKLLEDALPGLLASLRFLGDCPATPNEFPFPPREEGTILEEILASGEVRLAFQFQDPAYQDTSPVQVGELRKAVWQFSKAMVEEVAKAYSVELDFVTTTYPTSAQSLQAVIDGVADMTDMFLRQWTLVPTVNPQVIRRVMVQPSCTMYLTTLSTTWIVEGPDGPRVGFNWTSLVDINAAGKDVIIPLYSTMQAFKTDIAVFLPSANFLDRPNQNFEENAQDIVDVLEEFIAGDTTVLMAAISDIEFASANNGVNFSAYKLAETQTPVDLPVGAFLRVVRNETANEGKHRPTSSASALLMSSFLTSLVVSICSYFLL